MHVDELQKTKTKTKTKKTKQNKTKQNKTKKEGEKGITYPQDEDDPNH